MSGLTREARTAARYWANKLRTPEAEFEDVERDRITLEAELRVQAAAIIAAAASGPEAVDRFEAILAKNISDAMSSGSPMVTISRQNVPDRILTRALAEAGIPEAWEAFPWMTTMVVKVGNVEVQEGIDAPFEEVPLLR